MYMSVYVYSSVIVLLTWLHRKLLMGSPSGADNKNQTLDSDIPSFECNSNSLKKMLAKQKHSLVTTIQAKSQKERIV